MKEDMEVKRASIGRLSQLEAQKNSSSSPPWSPGTVRVRLDNQTAYGVHFGPSMVGNIIS
jgi:hypothetical protein